MDMIKRNYRNIFFISLSQAGMSFCFNFVMVFLPFSIHEFSQYSAQATLIWVGLIMGAPSLLAAIFSTVWGAATNRFSSKFLFMRGLLSHALVFLLMGFFTSLPILFVLRVIQGVLGGISTVGLIIVSASTSREHASKDIGFFQNSMTLGQLLGPPVGALAASAWGYRTAFVSASSLIFVILAFCYLYVVEPPHRSKERGAVGKHTLNRRTLIAWALCFTATVQLMFLPSVLPNVFQGFNMVQATALKWAGLVVMLYTTTALLGTHFLCRLAVRTGLDKLIISVAVLGILLQSLLSVSQGINSFLAIRMLQVFFIAAITPLVFSMFTSELDGKVMGFLNSGRFTGNALGPVIGTFILAFSSLNWLYLSVSGMGLLALMGFVFFFGSVEESDGQTTN
jgi:DHA1 family tetracycline resistance protein-like MFS transporter